MTVTRLDTAMLQRGLVRSRTQAQRHICAGEVLVNSAAVTKPSHKITAADTITLTAAEKYVSRGAYKLLAALQNFDINPAGHYALDLGASTGGFTQVLLEHGAAPVTALDVGHSQLAPQLRNDPRVRIVEGYNARHLTAANLSTLTGEQARPTLVVGDLSFISLQHIFPAIAATAAPNATIIMLIKPQFELDARALKNGVVTDPLQREKALTKVLEYAATQNYETQHLAASPITGTTGNHEYLGCWRRSAQPHPAQWKQRIQKLAAAKEE